MPRRFPPRLAIIETSRRGLRTVRPVWALTTITPPGSGRQWFFAKTFKIRQFGGAETGDFAEAPAPSECGLVDFRGDRKREKDCHNRLR